MKVESDLPIQLNARLAAASGEGEVPEQGFGVALEGARGEKSAAQAERFAELQDSFYEWRSELDTTHPLNLARYDQVTADSDSFLAIVERAVVEDGYSDPLAFAKRLSRGELDTLKAMHSTGNLDPATMSEEGALNLILPFDDRQDIDNDGFVEKGNGVGWTFPPVNAPRSVHDAWEKSTEGMTAGEEMRAQGAFLPSMLHRDGASGKVSQMERSEANNPYARADFSYSDIAQKRLDSLEAFKFRMTPEQFDFQKDFLTRFYENLAAPSVG